jgi:hypothetical protein
MRRSPGMWFAKAVLLAALAGGARTAAGSVAVLPAGPDGPAGASAGLTSRAEAAAGLEAVPLALSGPAEYLGSAATGAGPEGPLALSFGRHGPRTPRAPRPAASRAALGGERARILLRSLTLPGWGQATLGQRTSAAFFGLTETAIWGTFTAFRIQVAMRNDAFLRTARLAAGIDLAGRDEEWRRIVGSFSSSDEYNRLVVARDAANLLYDDPAAYRAYIAAHSLKGADTWNWSSPADQEHYRDQRKRAQRAALRANTTLAVAVVNRIASALHAARVAGHPAPAARSWQFEIVPVASEDATAFQCRVRARF